MQPKARSMIALVSASVLSLACLCTDLLPEDLDELVGGLMPGDTPSVTQEIPSVTETEEVATSDPLADFWQSIAGMWSGCPADAGGGLFLDICQVGPSGYPIGPFITLHLPPSCNVGESCGVYVKGAFESEFILFTLTLQEVTASSATFYADSGDGMYSGLDRTMVVELVSGQLFIVESEGERYYLSPGCNQIIADNFQCITTP